MTQVFMIMAIYIVGGVACFFEGRRRGLLMGFKIGIRDGVQAGGQAMLDLLNKKDLLKEHTENQEIVMSGIIAMDKNNGVKIHLVDELIENIKNMSKDKDS
jgi:hypothetical protein